MEAEMENISRSNSYLQVREVEAEMRSVSRMERSQDMGGGLNMEFGQNMERRAERAFVREPERSQYQGNGRYYAPETQYIPGVPEYSDDMDYGSYDPGEYHGRQEILTRTSEGEDQDDWGFR